VNARARRGRAAQLTGRSSEIRELGRLIDAVRAGDSRVLVLRGGIPHATTSQREIGHSRAGCGPGKPWSPTAKDRRSRPSCCDASGRSP
jgi:hypothetical protein